MRSSPFARFRFLFPPFGLGFLLLIAGCGTGSAPPTPSPPLGERSDPIADPSAVARVGPEEGSVEVDADSVLDFRSWRLIPMRVTASSFTPGVDRTGSELRMGAIAVMAGPQHPVGPNQSGIQLFFLSISDRRVYENRGGTLELRIGTAAPVLLEVFSYRDSPGQGYVLETLGVRIPPELALRLSRSTQVEGRLGPTDFVLDPEKLDRIRAYIGQLPPELLGAVAG